MSRAESEPVAGPWRSRSLDDFAERILTIGTGSPRRAEHRMSRVPGPLVVAIDGRSGSGKSTLADRLVQIVPAAQIVHTDDIAWFYSAFDWSEALVTGVLDPLAEERDVQYRPPGWVQRDRAGCIEVSARAPLVIIEGVGSSRRELKPFIDCAVWVQSDAALAKKRRISRDIQTLGDAAERQWQDWQDQELPFLSIDEPWLRADVIVGGSDQLAHDHETDVIVAPAMR